MHTNTQTNFMQRIDEEIQLRVQIVVKAASPQNDLGTEAEMSRKKNIIEFMVMHAYAQLNLIIFVL